MATSSESGVVGLLADEVRPKRHIAARACQACRYRKKRCDRLPTALKPCSHCIAYKFECVFDDGTGKPTAPKKLRASFGYADILQERLSYAEDLLQRLRDAGLDGTSTSNGAAESAGSVSSGSRSTPTFSREQGSYVAEEQLPDDDPLSLRFVGESGSTRIIQEALDARTANEALGERTTDSKIRVIDRWKLPQWEDSALRSENQRTDDHQIKFPDPDMTSHLIDLYFANLNLYYPLLHRPIFVRAVTSKLHLRNRDFASVYLLVCACAARYTDDPRARLDREKPQSAGWHWFQQVTLAHLQLMTVPSLYAIQSYCLAIFFLHGTSAVQTTWTLAGIGLRMAQDVGAHRRSVYSDIPNISDELWKRAFWILVYLDRGASASMGRPCAIQNEDFDVDLPIEIDDQYWVTDNSDEGFAQPPGQPSLISGFVALIGLGSIVGTTLQTLYSSRRPESLLGPSKAPSREQSIAQLDSQLNEWMDALPDHLRWDPQNKHDTFFNQSSVIITAYYTIQIIVHRTLLPDAVHPSSTPIPSLFICLNAARACSHAVEHCSRRQRFPPMTLEQAAFVSGVVLMLGIRGSKQAGLSTDLTEQVEDVHKCIDFIGKCEESMYIAGRHADLLRGLLTISDLPTYRADPVTPPQPPSQQKREEIVASLTVYGFTGLSFLSDFAGETHRPDLVGPSTGAAAAPPSESSVARDSHEHRIDSHDGSRTDAPELGQSNPTTNVQDFDNPAEAMASIDAMPELHDLQPPLFLGSDSLDLWSSIPWTGASGAWATYIDSFSTSDADRASFPEDEEI